jgi:uncharacterized protein (TIGR02444 family)
MNAAFWAFSLRFYQLDGVSESCLELQDHYGADVNMVLFALWTASSGHLLDAAAIADAERTARPWREAVTRPLRAARRALKAGLAGFDAADIAALRQQVMAAELEAERLQQGAMAARLAADAQCNRLDAARENLRRYEAQVGKPFGAGPIERLLKAFVAEFSETIGDGEAVVERS